MNVEQCVRESNRIEGIYRNPTKAEMDEFRRFINLEEVTLSDLLQFVSVYQPDARLRIRPGWDVYVGSYVPPAGGEHIGQTLKDILSRMNSERDEKSAFLLHQEYESLHPFMDCNGRSGRMLWYWMMGKRKGMGLGFLHMWYYQSLMYQHDR